MSEFYGAAESSAYLKDAPLERAIPEGEVAALHERMKALDKLLANATSQAKYKIEVQFGRGRSSLAHKPFVGAISLFLSGTKFHGGGDEKLYICPAPQCEGVIDPRNRMGSTVLCAKCKSAHREVDLIGELLFRLTPQSWAQAILNQFIRLEHNADIYLKYHPTDIRYQTMLEAAKDQGGEALAVARKNRGLHTYTLRNIITDTKNGADLYKRILAFITA